MSRILTREELLAEGRKEVQRATVMRFVMRHEDKGGQTVGDSNIDEYACTILDALKIVYVEYHKPLNTTSRIVRRYRHIFVGEKGKAFAGFLRAELRQRNLAQIMDRDDWQGNKAFKLDMMGRQKEMKAAAIAAFDRWAAQDV